MIKSTFSFLNEVLTPVVDILSKFSIYTGVIGVIIGFILLFSRLFFKKGIASRVIFVTFFASCMMIAYGKMYQGMLEKDRLKQIATQEETSEQKGEKDVSDTDLQSKSKEVEQTTMTVEQQEQETKTISEDQKTDENVIPGITAADIKLNFEDKGFKFTGPKPMQESDGYFDNGKATDPATGIEYSITIDELTPSKVRVVQYRADGTHLAGVIDHNTFLKVAKEFLGHGVTLPYDGSKPDQARKWVEENIQKVKQGNPVKTVIGPVEIMLAGDGYFRYIQLKPIEQER